MSRQRGFTLIELLITVALILIIAAISIPNLLRSRLAANEASAVATLHSVNVSQMVYSTTYGLGFSQNLASLGGTACLVPTSSGACLLDTVLASDPANKSGYAFTYTPVVSGGLTNSYQLVGAPISPGNSGVRYFYTDQSSVIRSNSSGPADNSSSPI